MRTIASLTSFGQRLSSTLPTAIQSINNQTSGKPDIIALYLSESDYSENKQILRRLPENVNIQTTDDIRSFKKYTALTDPEYENDTVWIVDDDLGYYDFNIQTFNDTYAKYNNPNAVYAHNVWSVKSFDENFYTNKTERGGLVKPNFVVCCNSVFFPPNTARFDREFLTEAFRTSPTCDDTYISPYLISRNIPVYKIKLPKGETRNYRQLDIPFNTLKLMNVNRPLWKSNVKRNFHRFGLYEPQPLITNLSTPRTT